eukprot:6186389-Pleurochrysis_carterae.AAC.1
MYVRDRRKHRADTGRALRARAPRARREPRAHGTRRVGDSRRPHRTRVPRATVGRHGPGALQDEWVRLTEC